MDSTERDTQLAKTLTVGRAVSLALGIVIGAGLLVLPGLAYSEVGNSAIYAWVEDAVIVIPLLVIFSSLGSHYPSAGGVAGFVRVAFGPVIGAMTELMLMSAFFLGIPGIALTGAGYLTFLFHSGGWASSLFAIMLLVIAGILNYLGTQFSAITQQVLSYSLVLILAAVAVIALTFDPASDHGVVSIANWKSSIPALGMVFFAYTGWEMLSFMGEEFHNPKRDFPIAIVISYVLIVLIYLAVALAVQWTLQPYDPQTTQAPIAAVLAKVFGNKSADVVAIIGVLIILANLNGAIWAASRLLFSSARERFLPRFLASVDLNLQIPRRSIVTCILVFMAVVVMHQVGWISQHMMFALAGQNFFLIYVLSVLVYIRLTRRPLNMLFALGVLVLCIIFIASFGRGLLYPLTISLLGLVLGAIHRRNTRKNVSSSETPR
ncbi:MAG: amino acid permease [Alicyclobacillus sp.]|nr:amino acid permease [Alicyclobacillus sp.]